jgi:murein DD-endopeptidase MepM/ murein hydrolase activator NlpD
MSAPVKDQSQVYQQMEAAILRQIMNASGAFKPSEAAGGQLRADMFVETLADAVAKGGGIGIAKMLQDSLSTDKAGAADDAGDAEGPPQIGGGATAAPLKPMSPLRPPAGAAATLSTHLPGQITSGFGQRNDPIDGTSKYHTGVDLRAAEGSPILAAGAGTVRNAGPRGGYGNAVEVDHGGGLTTLYGHASELLVKPGDKVAAGQTIARVGQTGRATGPHLHFEVRVNDRPVDPTSLSPASKAALPKATPAGVLNGLPVVAQSGIPVGSSLFANRALNAYRRRAEETVVGKLSPPRSGESP